MTGGVQADARQTASQLLQIVRAHYFVAAESSVVAIVVLKVILTEIGTARHGEAIVSYSLFVRL